MIERLCQKCGRSFKVSPCIIRSGHGIFCSKSCSAKSRKNPAGPQNGPNNHNWKGGVILSTKGYWYVWRPDHVRADKKGYVKRADLIMEEVLGRSLESDEVVHHGPGGKEDDSPGNLSVMISKDHSSYHCKNNQRLKRYKWPSDEQLLEFRKKLSFRELAKIVGCSDSTVRQHIKRILESRRING